ncbi:uncharacterized protein LOC130622264 isoform X1 [Hydractinia symbiolongicarpus]|uniref:uncharacterized protein LOC130622264 isoform X1 n=1 Tax=Hydractinia symbiolongicarpus TaxID=13093 RepID=UPI00254F1076|nr:uncharacterized protein LOC130622264 isoform X1 [Hydractinia symbiolongicarpus]
MVNIPDGQQVRVKQPIYVCEDKDACLYAHNKVRSYHGVGTLSWDERLARDAKNWAIYLIENNCFMHDKRIHDGENLYVISGDPEFHRVYQAVQEFYEEIRNYDFVNPEIYKNNHDLFHTVGHFTQVVWKDSTKVGCCVAFDNALKKTVIVCRYSIGQNYDNSIQVRPQVQNENGELFIPQCEDLIWENDVKPTIRRVNHYIK